MQIQIERTESQRFFEEQGFLTPVSVLTPEECEPLRTQLQAAPAPLDWAKGHAATSSAFFRLATHPAIIQRVVELIGEDVMLWGASLVRRSPARSIPGTPTSRQARTWTARSASGSGWRTRARNRR